MTVPGPQPATSATACATTGAGRPLFRVVQRTGLSLVDGAQQTVVADVEISEYAIVGALIVVGVVVQIGNPTEDVEQVFDRLGVVIDLTPQPYPAPGGDLCDPCLSNGDCSSDLVCINPPDQYVGVCDVAPDETP